ncbi:hypothetical protein FGU65_08470 [Methanoculleus sp. FWC-SCC1]|uniref:Uncharacterized protein n=1 Tax=Methanoculleus frigidifontis TaxID=2584085 RepID=A0ABT8MAJ3_9EURY|nr:hypothetical protein [Methanoculleus sp. FWC-SCC1]MDN7024920.1 hypothetical protein [Methanoculleus sp. FWC-SCC1]
MPREKIIDGDLAGGTGVEGRRSGGKKDEHSEKAPVDSEQPREQSTGKPPSRKPRFGQGNTADIFYSEQK